MQTGTVKWFNDEKGYGFIDAGDMDGRDVFVHYSAISGNGHRSLQQGDVVSFEWREGERGRQATIVELCQSGIDHALPGSERTVAGVRSVPAARFRDGRVS